jgi:hypothetical protein
MIVFGHLEPWLALIGLVGLVSDLQFCVSVVCSHCLALIGITHVVGIDDNAGWMIRGYDDDVMVGCFWP